MSIIELQSAMKFEMAASTKWLDDLLRDAENARKHFDTRWKVNDKTWGVTGSTFRAFTGLSIPPSTIYREWAAIQALKIEKENIADLARFRVDLQTTLTEGWDRSDAELPPTYRNKLIDLFLMHMARSPDIRDDTRTTLIIDGNVPLDLHSLRGLGLILPAMAIGSPSMGAIGDDITYNAIQDTIRQITANVGIPNLYFDIWTWPTHRRKQADLPPSVCRLKADKAT